MAKSFGQPPASRFIHRFNVVTDDYDSICKLCAKTIGSSAVEAELLYFELEHKCQTGILIDFPDAARRNGKASAKPK